MDPGAGNEHHRTLLMATSAQFQWPSPRSFVSAYTQNLMSADMPALSVPEDLTTAFAVMQHCMEFPRFVREGWL